MKPDYKTAVYTVAVELPKPPAEIFPMLTDLKKWWPEDFNGDDFRLNSAFELTVGEGHYSKNRVTEFVPGKKLVWMTISAMRESDGFDWTGTKFIFELLPHGSNTIARFTYDGVVLAHEVEKLEQICDMTMKDFFYNYIVNGKTK